MHHVAVDHVAGIHSALSWAFFHLGQRLGDFFADAFSPLELLQQAAERQHPLAKVAVAPLLCSPCSV